MLLIYIRIWISIVLWFCGVFLLQLFALSLWLFNSFLYAHYLLVHQSLRNHFLNWSFLEFHITLTYLVIDWTYSYFSIIPLSIWSLQIYWVFCKLAPLFFNGISRLISDLLSENLGWIFTIIVFCFVKIWPVCLQLIFNNYWLFLINFSEKIFIWIVIFSRSLFFTKFIGCELTRL